MKIALEGQPFGDGRMVEHGAIYCLDEKIPVTWGYNYQQILGYATDFQRNVFTGVVSMVVHLHPDFQRKIDLEKCEAHVSLTGLEMKSDVTAKLSMIVTRGRLREIVLTEPNKVVIR